MKSPALPDPPERPPAPSNLALAIFLISVFGLFLELLLIRWVATEVRIFAYLQNTVLVVCFLGLGMGCFSSHRRAELWQALAPLALLVLFLALPFAGGTFGGISEMLSVLGDPLIWYEQQSDSPLVTIGRVAMGLALTLVLMTLLWATFLPIGRLLGRWIDEHPAPIFSYSVNVGGSLLGIWSFTALSALRQPPFVWFLVAAGLSLPFLTRSRGRRAVEVMLLGVILIGSWIVGTTPEAVETVWSPYQKLVMHSAERDGRTEYWMSVNDVDFQELLDLSEENVAANPDTFPQELRGFSQYDLPLRFHPDPAAVLIVGAGAGNDAAGALRNGARSITAVEIDPVVMSFGRSYHPERPYDSPAVDVVIDDARSFFARTTDRYDLILFGLLDSHTTHAMTNARLDHYVYTRESIRRARALLAEGGLIALTFEAQKTYIADRMARLLREEFSREPVTIRVPSSPYGWGGVMFVAGEEGALETMQSLLERETALGDVVDRWSRNLPFELTYTTRVTTDDWPYLYLPGPGIPTLYWLLAGLMVVLFIVGGRFAGCPRLLRGWQRTHWHFFALGAAFLLLEVQNISKAIVALGNTWWVNAIIISGVLTMVLLANWTVRSFPGISVSAVYAGLVASCVALYFVDLAWFAGLPYALKAPLVGGVTTLPMFFSGIVFVRSFAASENRDEALGANLVGALIGGLLQTLSFLTGVKLLLLVVSAFYCMAWVLRPRGQLE